MKVTFSMRLDDGLRARLEERAKLEKRSLASLIERLLELGLGTVEVDDLESSVDPVGRASVSGKCYRWNFHRSGVYCKACGITPK